MSAAFTPAPWIVDDDGYEVYAHPEGVATTIADCNSGRRVVQDDDECHANARLTASAPELYEAARLFVEEYDAGDQDDGTEMMLAYSRALNAAKAALAKARGEAL